MVHGFGSPWVIKGKRSSCKVITDFKKSRLLFSSELLRDLGILLQYQSKALVKRFLGVSNKVKKKIKKIVLFFVLNLACSIDAFGS